MSETEYFKILTEKLEAHCQEGPIRLWTDLNFVKLSQDISKKTGILISKNTLKRLFGKIKVAYDYKPQRATKLALAKFLGYNTWYDFCVEVNPQYKEDPSLEELLNQEEEEDENQPRDEDQGITGKRKFILIFSIFGLLVLAGLAFLFYPKARDQNEAELPFEFQIKNPSDTVPFTMVFHYVATGFAPDSAVIKMPEGKIHLASERTTFTNNITLPTYTWITFSNGVKKLKSIPIHCLSRGWEFRTREGKNFQPLAQDDFIRNGNFQIDSILCKKFGPDPSRNWSTDIRNVKNFNLEGDNFEFEIRLQSLNGPTECLGSSFKFFGAHGHNEFRFFPKGCRQHNYISLGEKSILGRYEDLTQIPFEHQNWNTLRIRIEKKKCELFVNEAQSFSASYAQAIGPLKGVFLDLSKYCRIDYFRLKNLEGKVLEAKEF